MKLLREQLWSLRKEDCRDNGPGEPPSLKGVGRTIHLSPVSLRFSTRGSAACAQE